VPDREQSLRVLRELESADRDAGASYLELDRLLEEVRTLRADLLGAQSFLSSVPAERERLQAESAAARRDLVSAEDAFAQAQDAVQTAGDAEKRDAEHFEVRARDRVSVARRRIAAADAESERLESAARDAEASARELYARAGSLAKALRDRPRVARDAGVAPAPSLEAGLDWTETAQAALLVARSHVGAEHEAVIRQANELGSVLLRESFGAVSVAVVARRVEQASK
jgi:chromosome segregation ATPase